MLRISFDLVKLILDECNMQTVRALAMTNRDYRELVKRYKQTSHYQNSSIFQLFDYSKRYIARREFGDVTEFRHRSNYLFRYKLMEIPCSYQAEYQEQNLYGASYMMVPVRAHMNDCYACHRLADYTRQTEDNGESFFSDRLLLAYAFSLESQDSNDFNGFDKYSLYIPMTLRALVALYAIVSLRNSTNFAILGQHLSGSSNFFQHPMENMEIKINVGQDAIGLYHKNPPSYQPVSSIKTASIFQHFEQSNPTICQRAKELAEQYRYETGRELKRK